MVGPAIPEYPSVDLSARLQAIFRHREHWSGHTQRAASVAMHVHNSILNLWVRGKRPVPGERIPALASALEMSVEELLDGVTLPPVRAVRVPKPSLPPTPVPLQRLPIGDVWRLPSRNYRRHCRVCSAVRVSSEPITGECCPVPAPVLLRPLGVLVPPVVRFDVFCFACARGLGHDGVRTFPRRLPTRRRCIWCGGVLLAEEVTSNGTLLRVERSTVGRYLDDATLDRAAR